MVHAARALPRHRRRLVLEHMQFGGRIVLVFCLAHREHVNLRAMRGIVADAAHVHDLGQHERGARQIVHGEHDRAEAADLVLGRHRTALPRRGRPRAAVVDQHQALAFAVLERQGQPAVDFDRHRRSRRRPAFRRSRQNPSVFSPATRKPVREIELVPRRSGAAGKSKKVRSVPGLALPSA